MKFNLQLFDEYLQQQQQSPSLAEATIQDIRQTSYGLRSKEEVTLHIRHQQIALNEYKQVEALQEACDEVLFYLETYFYSYLDDALPMSLRGIRKEQDKFALWEIRNKFFFTLDPELLLALSPLFFMDSPEGYSVYTARYIAKLHQRWKAAGYDEQGIADFLLLHNYNHLLYYEYVIGKMTGELESETDDLKKISLLTKHLYHIHKIPMVGTAAFGKDFPSLKSMLMQWLKKTIKQHKKSVKNAIPNQLPLFTEKKIETSLSVAQTAALLKLLYNEGILTNKVQGDILHVISRSFKSKRTEEISLGSLQNKYYNIEDKANESLKTILQKLSKRLVDAG
ncbi:MAG: hypothetical protein JWO58_1929 [Chitinophagaceae bacterium]|nr:hypothetical protein [Chitinophagaceae bacterium]